MIARAARILLRTTVTARGPAMKDLLSDILTHYYTTGRLPGHGRR